MVVQNIEPNLLVSISSPIRLRCLLILKNFDFWEESETKFIDVLAKCTAKVELKLVVCKKLEIVGEWDEDKEYDIFFSKSQF